MDGKLRNKISGFTLVTIVVSIAILIILGMIAIPSMHATLTNSRLKAASTAFAQQLRLARSEAIQKQASVYFTVTPGSQWCSGINENSACSCSPSNTCSLGSIYYNDYSGPTLTITSGFSSGNIYFESIRGLPSEAGEVSFQDGDKTIKVIMNAIGQITFCATNVAGYPSC